MALHASRGVARIQFFGGPRDGELMGVSCNTDGYPALRIALGARRPPPMAQLLGRPDPQASAEQAIYQRGVLDPERGIWQYVIQG